MRLHKIILKLPMLVIFLISPLWAQEMREPPADREQVTVFSDSDLISQNLESVAVSLALVLLSIFVLAWFVRYLGASMGRSSGSFMKVISVLPLNAKEKLLLVDVAGRHMLLSVGAAGTRCVHVFDEALQLEKVVSDDRRFQDVLHAVIDRSMKHRE